MLSCGSGRENAKTAKKQWGKEKGIYGDKMVKEAKNQYLKRMSVIVIDGLDHNEVPDKWPAASAKQCWCFCADLFWPAFCTTCYCNTVKWNPVKFDVCVYTVVYYVNVKPLNMTMSSVHLHCYRNTLIQNTGIKKTEKLLSGRYFF